MATIARGPGAVAAERRFFLIMALAIALTVFAGFGLDFVTGRAVFTQLPWQVHAHGAVFSSWILLYVVQNWLVVTGNAAIHRRLGTFAAGLAVLMVVLGIFATIMAIRRGATPPFFPPGIFLMLDVLYILAFGSLTAAAIVLRARPDWHKRLMLCGTVMVMSPALGRLLPMPLFGSFAPFAVYGSLILYVFAAMLYDLARRGRIHPAYWWGAGALTLAQMLVGPLGFSAPVLAFTARLAAG